MLEITHEIRAARERHTWNGRVRPEFAHAESEGEESVWDYPRPPVIVPDIRLVQVYAEGILIADSEEAVRVLETGSPPCFYLPPDDVEWDYLEPNDRQTTCPWKGIATYYDAVVHDERIPSAGWAYQRVFPEFADLQGWIAFYPAKVTCLLEGETVYPQPGQFYGGWVTRGIIGPFKGAPGSENW